MSRGHAVNMSSVKLSALYMNKAKQYIYIYIYIYIGSSLRQLAKLALHGGVSSLISSPPRSRGIQGKERGATDPNHIPKIPEHTGTFAI